MRKLFSLSALLLFVCLTGCQTNQPTDYNQLILKNQTAIRSVSQFSTAMSLASIESVKDRTQAARSTYEIATAINKASGTQTDLSGVNQIAEQYLNQWNSPYKPVVGSAINLLSTTVQSWIDTYYASADADTRLKALRALLLYASQGAMDGSLPYTQASLSTMKMTAQPPPKNPIVVKPLDWKTSGEGKP